MIKTVNILTFEGTFERVWGVVEGNLAIVPYMTYEGRKKKRYNITHIPTGCCVGAVSLGKESAKVELQRWHNKKWRDIPLENMPPCEIVTNYELIANDLKEPASKETKELINNAYCK